MLQEHIAFNVEEPVAVDDLRPELGCYGLILIKA
jgi:hypothetical protein